jgi:uncharacterized phage-associated protein
MDWGKLRADKALEIILYVTSKGCTNMYNVLKVIYFADKEHLRATGGTLCKDWYRKMKDGPVAIGIFDIINYVRHGKSDYLEYSPAMDVLEFQEPYFLTAKRPYNPSFFSDLDYQCLDRAIQEFGAMDFWTLRGKSHEGIDFQNIPLNNPIPFDLFVQSIDDEKGSLQIFLKDCLEEAPC